MNPCVAPILFLLAPPLFAQVESTRTFQKTVTLPAAARVEVENRFGDVLVRAQPGREAAITAVIKASARDLAEAKRAAESVVIDVQQTGAALSIRTRYPDQERWLSARRRNVSYSVRYDIVLPETAPLTIRNSFGGVVVTDVKADAVISNSNGKVVLRDGRGTHRLENTFGPLEVEGNSGDVWIVNANGNVRATDITGSADVRNQFGEVLVRKVSGTVKIANGNGDVELSGAGGTATVTNSFGPVTASGVKGNLTVRNANGEVNATGIAGEADLKTTFAAVKFYDIGKRLTVKSDNSAVSGSKAGAGAEVEASFGPVDLRDVAGAVTVRNANGDVTLADIGGEIHAKTSFGQVTAERAGGAVTVENENGAVTVSGVPAKPCSAVALTTSFSPMKLYLAEGSGYNITAKTSFGTIRSELAVEAAGKISGEAVAGRIGGGGCELRLTNSNGGIEILKAYSRRP